MENARSSKKQQSTSSAHSFSSRAQSTRSSHSTSLSSSEPAPRDTSVSLEHLSRFPYSLARLAIMPPTSQATPASAQQQSTHVMQQKQAHQERSAPAIQRMPSKPNNTGLPDALKAGVEKRSGLSMDDVHVHYNSSKPAQVQALAYTQGTEIHMGPRQEQHLAHEAWHVVQQKQGRVKATSRVHGMPLNNEAGLEREAEQRGKTILANKSESTSSSLKVSPTTPFSGPTASQPVQRFIRYRIPSESAPKNYVLSNDQDPFTELGSSVIFRWYLGTVLKKKKTSQAVSNALIAMRDDQHTTWTLDSGDQSETASFLNEIDDRIGLHKHTWKLQTYLQERASYMNTSLEEITSNQTSVKKKLTASKSTPKSGTEAKGEEEVKKPVDEGNVLGPFVKESIDRPIEYTVKGLTGTPIRTIYVSEEQKRLLDELYKDAQATMEQEQYPQFSQLKEAPDPKDQSHNIVNDIPKVGVEIELKGLFIDVSARPDIAVAAAIAGHKPIAEKDNIEIHIDAAAGSGKALIEIVTKPLTLTQLLNKLKIIKEHINTKDEIFAWLKEFSTSEEKKETSEQEKSAVSEQEEKVLPPKERILDFLLKNPSTQFTKNQVHVQLTTTLTEKEFQGTVAQHTVFKHRPAKPNYTLADVLKSTPEKTKSSKNSYALIKHAYEQLREAKDQTIPDETRVDKVPFIYTNTKGEQQTAKLHTYANKISPLFVRKGQRAFLVEYRGGDSTTKHFILRIKQYLENTGNVDISEVKTSIADAFPHLKSNKGN